MAAVISSAMVRERRILAGDPERPLLVRDVRAMTDAEIEQELCETLIAAERSAA
jgi:hypothetical protein